MDVSIRPSWGYVEGEEKQLYSLETLLYMYEKAVGGNATLLLNVPPNKEGLFDLEDVERLAELGKAIRGLFSRPPWQKPFRRMEVMQRLYWMQTEHTLWNLQGNARR